jgi:hypothetical protein
LMVNRLNAAVPSFYVMPYGGHRSTPLMLGALAGIIARALTASRATAVRTINNGLCIATSTTRNSEACERSNYRGSNEPTVNARTGDVLETTRNNFLFETPQ